MFLDLIIQITEGVGFMFNPKGSGVMYDTSELNCAYIVPVWAMRSSYFVHAGVE